MKDELKETVRSITPKFLLLYIIGSVSLSMFLGFYSSDNWASGFGAALTAINLSSSMFIFGAPFVIGASLLLPSFKLSKDSISQTYENLNARYLTIARFLVLFILTTAFTISWILLSYHLAIQDYLHVSTDLILVYLPGTIISGLIMTFVLSAVTTFIATLLDDWKLALITNFALFFILVSTLGSTSHLDAYDTLAIFGPYHLYRFLALAASGNVSDPIFGTVWGNPTLMNMILGINFGFADILISVGLWISLSIVLLIITQYTMSQNLNRMRIEFNLNRFAQGDQKLLKQLKESTQFLRQKRLALGTALVLMLITLPLLQFSTTFASEQEAAQTLHQSEIILHVGLWAYGEVEVSPPTEGLYNMYQMKVEILDWGDCPDELERWSLFEEISSSDFDALNETEKDDLTGTRYSCTPDRTVIGGGFWSFQSTGTHVWAIKFVPAEGYPLEGSLRIIITITVRAE